MAFDRARELFIIYADRKPPDTGNDRPHRNPLSFADGTHRARHARIRQQLPAGFSIACLSLIRPNFSVSPRCSQQERRIYLDIIDATSDEPVEISGA
jgi:hypothetical protein